MEPVRGTATFTYEVFASRKVQIRWKVGNGGVHRLELEGKWSTNTDNLVPGRAAALMKDRPNGHEKLCQPPVHPLPRCH
jgi:hypothetical protein